MADNVGITTGADATVATDEISGKHHQRVKLSVGADGSAADLPNADDNLGVALPSGGMLWDGSDGVFKKQRTARSVGDGVDGVNVPISAGLFWNDELAAYSRVRSNHRQTMLASAARTAYTASSVAVNYNHRGVLIDLSVTSAGSDSISVFVSGSDLNNVTPIGGVLTVTAAQVAAAPGASHSLILYPGVDASALWGTDYYMRKAVSAPLPSAWYVGVNPEGSSSWTYSVTAQLLV